MLNNYYLGPEDEDDYQDEENDNWEDLNSDGDYNEWKDRD